MTSTTIITISGYSHRLTTGTRFNKTISFMSAVII